MTTTTNGAAKLWAAVAAAAILVLAITVAMAYNGVLGTAGTASATDPEANGDAHVVEVEFSEFAFSPAPITVPADTPLVFELTNVGAVPHDFHVDGHLGSEVIAGGESVTLEVDGIPAGQYRVHCDEPGHANAGMTATLVATEDGAVSAAKADMTVDEMAAKHDDLSDFPYDSERGG